MNIGDTVALTEQALAREDGSMGGLLRHFRHWISPTLVGESEWERVLECADELPATMGALPFGFELPLHTDRPEADFGVSLASGTRPAAYFRERAGQDETAAAVTRLFGQIDAENSPLRKIVGRQLMLEYDIGSAREGETPLPGIFLIPRERPIIGGRNRADDARLVTRALVDCIGWEASEAEGGNVASAYRKLPEDARMESFGVFPSRPRAIRLAIAGFKSRQALCSWLEDTAWPGRVSTVESAVARLGKRVNIVGINANVDALEKGLGATLGLTLTVRERRGDESEYWLDGRTDWNPFLEALRHERLVDPEKLAALAGWMAKPMPLLAKSGQYVLLRGIHHLKLAVGGNRLRQAKAYVYMALSATVAR